MSDFISTLKDSVDIVNIIGSRINLKRSGNKFAAICPFHRDTNRSFYVYPESQSYYCFGCGRSGDVIEFLKEYNKQDFKDVVEDLADSCGLELPKFSANPEVVQKATLRKMTYEINKAAGIFYIKQYAAPNNPAKQYMEKRGFTENVTKKIGIGYSPNSYDVIKHLRSLGYSDKDIVDSGIGEQSHSGVRDAFAGRLIIPIIDAKRNVLGFGGRDLTGNTDKVAKYKNTRETEVFKKKRVLYGINLFKKNHMETHSKEAIIVEGYMDLIAMYQFGIKNVVASMGTALSKEQINTLKDTYGITTIYFCYDGDSAGKNAMLRNANEFKDLKIYVKIVSIPNNEDPDEYIKENGVEEFKKLLGKAKNLNDYIVDVIKEKYDLSSNTDKSNFAKEVLLFLRDNCGMMVAETYIDDISKQTQITNSLLRETLKNEQEVKIGVDKKVEESPMGNDIRIYLFSLYADNFDPALCSFYLYKPTKEQDTIYQKYKQLYENNVKADLSMLLEMGEEGNSIANCTARSLNKNDRMTYLKDVEKKVQRENCEDMLIQLGEKQDGDISDEERVELNRQIREIINKMRGLDSYE